MKLAVVVVVMGECKCCVSLERLQRTVQYHRKTTRWLAPAATPSNTSSAVEKIRERAQSGDVPQPGWKRGAGAASVLSWARADSVFRDREKVDLKSRSARSSVRFGEEQPALRPGKCGGFKRLFS